LLDNQPPIIVRRIRKVHKGHGGAWKVAFADFATAMMAFFLVLWLGESTNQEQKEAISGYFIDPIGFTSGGSPNAIDLGGSITVEVLDGAGKDSKAPDLQLQEATLQDIAVQLEQRKLAELMKHIVEKINSSEQLLDFKDQLIIDITQEGLRIQIVDKSQRPMFDSGDDEIKPSFEDILYVLADTISSVPNKVSLSGHTDGVPYVGREDYSNWELSTDRANAARRALVDGGLPNEQISRVVGLASSTLYDEENPLNPVNRRISIIVLNSKTQQEIEGAEAAESLVSASDLDADLNPGKSKSDKLVDGSGQAETTSPTFATEDDGTVVIDLDNLLDSGSLPNDDGSQNGSRSERQNENPEAKKLEW